MIRILHKIKFEIEKEKMYNKEVLEEILEKFIGRND